MSETANESTPQSAEYFELLAWADEPPPSYAPPPGVEPRADGIPTDKLLADLMEPAFATLRPRWGVTRAECEALGGAWAAVIDKYFPDLEVGPELAAVLITVQIVGPRVAMERHQQTEAMTDAGER